MADSAFSEVVVGCGFSGILKYAVYVGSKVMQ